MQPEIGPQRSDHSEKRGTLLRADESESAGTEHRAALSYHGEISRMIQEKISSRIVLHGAFSVLNDKCVHSGQTASEGEHLDGAGAGLLSDNFYRYDLKRLQGCGRADGKKLIEEGVPTTEKRLTGDGINIACFTTLYRQTMMLKQMRKMLTDYYEMCYQ